MKVKLVFQNVKKKNILFSGAPNADEHFLRTTKRKPIKVNILYIECRIHMNSVWNSWMSVNMLYF